MSDVMRCPMHGAPLVPLSQKRWEEGPPDPNGYECGCDYGKPQPIRVTETAKTRTERVFHCGCEKVDRCIRDLCSKCCYCGREPEVVEHSISMTCQAPDVFCDQIPKWSGRCGEHYWRMVAGQEPGQVRPTATTEPTCCEERNAGAPWHSENCPIRADEYVEPLDAGYVSALTAVRDNTCFVKVSCTLLNLRDRGLIVSCDEDADHRCGWRVTWAGNFILSQQGHRRERAPTCALPHVSPELVAALIAKAGGTIALSDADLVNACGLTLHRVDDPLHGGITFHVTARKEGT
jgi:hypothetical protein